MIMYDCLPLIPSLVIILEFCIIHDEGQVLLYIFVQSVFNCHIASLTIDVQLMLTNLSYVPFGNSEDYFFTSCKKS